MITQQQPIPVAATMPLTVTLEAQQWQQVMTALNEAPYRIAAPLVEAITQQFQQQAAAAASGNGVDPEPLLPGEVRPVEVPQPN